VWSRALRVRTRDFMNRLLSVFAVVSACLMGCATSSVSVPVAPVAEPWPESVAETCPKRSTSICCWEAPPTPQTFVKLQDKLRSCLRPGGGESVLVKLRVETLGGRASCVDWTPRHREDARCIATVFARHLLIEGSPAEERCSFTYPVRFEY